MMIKTFTVAASQDTRNLRAPAPHEIANHKVRCVTQMGTDPPRHPSCCNDRNVSLHNLAARGLWLAGKEKKGKSATRPIPSNGGGRGGALGLEGTAMIAAMLCRPWPSVSFGRPSFGSNLYPVIGGGVTSGWVEWPSICSSPKPAAPAPATWRLGEGYALFDLSFSMGRRPRRGWKGLT